MKLLKITLFLIIIASVSSLTSCTSSSAKTATFKVWGNCGMCKETIEKSLKIDGVIKADWSKDTKIMTIKYDTLKINLNDIHTKIASVGYDTELMKGDDKAYASLHECCQYKRK